MMEIFKGKRILIVDDETDLREPIVMEFESLGCKVFEAENGKVAFDLLQREKVDAVVSDIRMPGGDGIELLKKIREMNPHFPAVMLITGFSDLSRQNAYHLGAESILTKPFDLDEVEAAVAKVLTPLETRWLKPATVETFPDRIEKTFPSLEKAVAEGKLALGRGGLFIELLTRKPSVGKKACFEINFEEGPFRRFEGVGSVRWSRAEKERELTEGLGLEFEWLAEPGKTQFLSFVRNSNVKSFIPTGPSAES